MVLTGPLAPCPLAPEQALELFLQVFLEYTKYTPASGLLHLLFISPGSALCLPRAPGRQRVQTPRLLFSGYVPWRVAHPSSS